MEDDCVCHLQAVGKLCLIGSVAKYNQTSQLEAIHQTYGEQKGDHNLYFFNENNDLQGYIAFSCPTIEESIKQRFAEKYGKVEVAWNIPYVNSHVLALFVRAVHLTLGEHITHAIPFVFKMKHNFFVLQKQFMETLHMLNTHPITLVLDNTEATVSVSLYI